MPADLEALADALDRMAAQAEADADFQLAVAHPHRADDFYRDRNNLRSAARVVRYLAPTDILTLIENAVGLDTGRAVKAYLVVLGFGALAAWRLWQMWKEPSFENVMVAQLAIMCAVLFGVVGHS